MAAEGVVLRDLIDGPENQSPGDQSHYPTSIQQSGIPHESATAHTQDPGPAQFKHDEEVDLGWNHQPEDIPDTLIGGLDNEDLWILIRRFNKQIFHLRQATKPPIGGLDLNVAAEEKFSPNKLRSQFERLYMGLIVGLLTFCKHVARLRSWNETRRTAVFCAIYFTAWATNHLMSTFMMLLTALFLVPSARTVLFPPAPLALVDYKTGGLAKPSAGTLGSTDTATGAPEHQRGEALENEASNFVTSIGAIALNTLTDADPHGEAETEGRSMMDSAPQPDAVATMFATAKDKAEGVDKPSEDKTKTPMQQKMWAQMRPLMHLLSLVSDIWERCGHLLSPVPPFDQPMNKLRVAGVVLTLMSASWFITANMVFRMTTLVVGAGLFGDPIIARVHMWLEKNYPDWKQLLDLNNTIFKGVPTDAQLAIALLRVGEANRAPLPPPPVLGGPPPEKPLELNDDLLDSAGGDQPLGASRAEINEASKHHAGTASGAGGNDSEMTSTTTDSKKRSKILAFFKGGFKGAVEVGVGVDKVRAKVGTESAKQRIGVIPEKDTHAELGRVHYEARFHGKEGQLHLELAGGTHTISFHETDKSMRGKMGLTEERGSEAQWTIRVKEIHGLMKHSGYGLKSKLLAGWAMDRQMRDSLEIVDGQSHSYVLTAMPFRDELFNRLCAIGDQRWEIL
ncbi:hypothetical protein SCUP234_04011 [Seiridium cupressi]